VTIHIRGIYYKDKRLSSGQLRRYWYHRATGTRLPDNPEDPGFLEAVRRLDKIAGTPIVAERTFSQLVREYTASTWYNDLAPSTKSEYARHISYLEPVFGPHPVRCIGRLHAEKFMQKFADRPTLAKAIKRTLSVMLTYAMEILRWIDANPLYGMEKKRKRKATGQRPYTEQEISIFRQTNPLGSRARLAFEIGLVTGFRLNDLTRIPASALRGAEIALFTSKTGQLVTLPVTYTMQAAFDAYVAARGAAGLPQSRYAISNEKGGKLHRRTLSADLLEAYEKAEFEATQRTHALRYTSAVRMTELGYSYADIAAHLGHAAAEMARRYCEKSRANEDLRRLIDVIDRGTVPPPAAVNQMPVAKQTTFRVSASRNLPNDREGPNRRSD